MSSLTRIYIKGTVEDHIFRSGQGKGGGNAKGKRTSTTMRAVVAGGRGGGEGVQGFPPPLPAVLRTEGKVFPSDCFSCCRYCIVYNKLRGNVQADIHTVGKSPKFKLSALLNMNIL